MNLHHLYQIPPIADWLYLGLFFSIIFIIILISEVTRKYLHWPQEVTRKIVHMAVGFLLLLTPFVLKTALPLLCIAAFFTVFNFYAIRKNLLPGIHIDRHNYGTVYYAMSFFILVFLFWDGYKVVILAGMIVMAVGDAAAAILGRAMNNRYAYYLIRDKKTLGGSLTMFLVSMLVLFITLKLHQPGSLFAGLTNVTIILFSAMTAIIATAAESLGDRGNDNLSVPVLSGIVLYFLLQLHENGLNQMLVAILLGLLAAFISVRLKYLTESGGVTAFILASILYGFGGWKWTVPILTFFVLSSILSKIGKQGTENIFEKGSQRDHTQVLANGGIPALFLVLQVLHPQPAFYFAHLGALAAAMADTWATEIGMRIGQQPRLITTLKKVPAGTSGGITLGGSIGAFLGALILAFSGLPYVFPPLFNHISSVLVIISFSGFVASFVDSVLGATVQVQYRCSICKKITEKRIHCHQKNSSVHRGIKWMNNDTVNFFNTMAGSILALVGFLIISYLS